MIFFSFLIHLFISVCILNTTNIIYPGFGLGDKKSMEESRAGFLAITYVYCTSKQRLR
jgi:hypothetical protein